ncbi:MAG: hypothetical protein EPN98_21525 [Phenylobacterium sp.]|uniref:baseplate J/gp47 family protein n=1 Tax=Phenylobacterium sp. TaxID=1871053 RepID=UPI00122AC53A|nr:baseplate J/gp47 family protein [Phenylobacterium sp.]TAL29025.1 MAG: hypothetical protein EPN98_21525 [Phenylobacterium sp.]
MASPYTLADLLTPQNLDQIRAAYLAALQGAGIPAVTEWLPKVGVEMAYVDMIARAIDEQIAEDLPDIVASGFLGKATGIFMDLLAQQVYQLERIAATSTTFNLQFFSAPAAPPYNLGVGDMTVIAPSGNHYSNTAAFSTKPGEASDPVPFQAATAGASFADDPSPSGAGVIFQMVTAFAGLTLQPASADFDPVTQSGSSIGQIKPVRSGATIPDPHTMVLRIDATGDVGSAQFSISLDGGPFAAQGTLLATNTGLAGGWTVIAQSGGATPSFRKGDTFTIISPGGPNYVQGSDEESNADLAARCRARWSTLSLNATKPVLYLWARIAYNAASRIQVTPDPVTAGQINIVVADSHGPISAVAARGIETFIAGKLRNVLASVRVKPATAFGLSTSGNVKVSAADKTRVQAAAQEAWLLYLGTVPLGGVVRLAELDQAIMDAGAIDTDGLAFDEVPANVQLGPGVVPQDGNDGGLAEAMTWQLL